MINSSNSSIKRNYSQNRLFHTKHDYTSSNTLGYTPSKITSSSSTSNFNVAMFQQPSQHLTSSTSTPSLSHYRKTPDQSDDREIPTAEGRTRWWTNVPIISMLISTFLVILCVHHDISLPSIYLPLHPYSTMLEHPFSTSSFYQVSKLPANIIKRTVDTSEKNRYDNRRLEGGGAKTRLAIVRPFCAFDAEALPTTFDSWDSFAPCKAASDSMGEEDFDDLGSPESKGVGRSSVDLFLFYSQSYSDSEEAVVAVDTIIQNFHRPGGWSQCFDNIYAIEAKIPADLDLYIPSAQDELFNWVNGPNRQFEAAHRIIQSGEWGSYDGFYLMEGDSIPVKSFWLDMVISTIEVYRPFAILGAKYNGDKWDPFYKQIPTSLVNHINGNAVYNTSHPLLDLLVGELEVEAPSPVNSFPYDYRMSQIMTEGALGIVPEIAPKILTNEDGENITMTNNTALFARWYNKYKDEHPFKETPVIQNFAATNIIPRHIGPEYIIHGAKLYAPWDPTKTITTLVISEWYNNRSNHLLSMIDNTNHPFEEVIILMPPDVIAQDEYDMTGMKVTPQHRTKPDFMDICEAKVDTEWFMMTNSYHQVAFHVDTMFTPAALKPVIPFTPATYPFCLKFKYCKESVNLAQRFNPGHDKVVEDFDMVFNTQQRDLFCKEWKRRYGSEGENLYASKNGRVMMQRPAVGPKGPTGTSYTAYLIASGKDKTYKFTDRSLYGARNAFFKFFEKEEKLDGMSPEELSKRVGILTTLREAQSNETCNCNVYDETECAANADFCTWRDYFEKCRPMEQFDGESDNCTSSRDNFTMDGWSGEHYESTKPTVKPTSGDGWTGQNWPVDKPSKLPTPQWVKNKVSPPPTKPDEWDYTRLTVIPKTGDRDDKKEIDPWFGTLYPKTNVTLYPKKSPDERNDERNKTDPWFGEYHPELEGDVDDKKETDPWFGEYHPELEGDVDDKKETDPWFGEYHPELKGDVDDKKETDPWFGEYHPELKGDVDDKKETDPWFGEYHPNAKDDVDDKENHPRAKGDVDDKKETDPWFGKGKKKNVDGIDFRSVVVSNGTMSTNNGHTELQRPTIGVNDVGFTRSLGAITDFYHSTDTLHTFPVLDLGFRSDVSDRKSTLATVIPEKKCSNWGPSLVPRPPLDIDTLSKISTGASDASSIIEHKLVLSDQIIDFLQADDAPILKSEELRLGAEEFGMDILAPVLDSTKEGPLDDGFVSHLDYGNCHPFEEGYDSIRCESDTSPYKPIRIRFVTNELETLRSQLLQSNKTESIEQLARVNALLKDILPSVSYVWSQALSVIPVQNYLYPVGSSCGEGTIFSSHKASGVSNADIVIYISGDGAFCVDNIPSYSSVCNYDQHMRPIVGNLALCLDDIDLDDFKSVSRDELLRQIGYHTHEIGKILGLSTSMFQHYRNPDSGKPWGTSYQNTTCVDGSHALIDLPNILKGFSDKGSRHYFEVTSPTVLQVVRNHFDCQRSTGARLDDHASSRSCFGSHFDERFYFGEDFTPLVDRSREAFTFTPLTLALLEDSSWYKANFTMTSLNPFGHGAGCGFLRGDCIVDGKVPDYSKGYFCSASSPSLSDSPSGCDYSHNFKASCDLSATAKPPTEYQLFSEEPDWGSKYADVDFCPMKSENQVSCADVTQSPTLHGEVFSHHSKCFETDSIQSVCLPSQCNPKTQRIEITVNNNIFRCDYDEQVINLGEGYQIECPRLASFCPEFVCPSSCSGKGICDYCLEVPQCICDNPFDESSGCWDNI